MSGKNIDIRDLIEEKKRKRRSTTINVVIFMILFISIIVLSVVSYLRTCNIDVLDKCKFLEKYALGFLSKENRTYKMNFVLSQKPKVCAYNKNIAMCTIESVDIYDMDGRLKDSNKINLPSPLISYSGKYLVVANAGGNNVMLFENSNKKYVISTLGSIVNVHVNCNGYVTVVTKGENVTSEVRVYDDTGKECFVKGKAQNYVVFAKLAKNNKDLVLNCVDTSATKLTAIFEFIDIRGKKVETMVSCEDTLFVDAFFIKDDNLVALTNDEVMYYNVRHTKVWHKKFDTKIYCCDVCDNRYVWVCSASDKLQDGISCDKTDVKIFNAKGKEVSTIKVDNIVKNMSWSDNVVALNLGKEVLLYNTKGKFIKKMTSKVEIDKVEFLASEIVVLVTKNGLIVKN